MLRLDDEIYVVVPFTVKSPPIVTPPLNVAVSDDWLPIVKLPPKSEFNAVAISAPVWSAAAPSSTLIIVLT